MSDPRAFVCGCAGLELSPEEIAFLRRWQPWGLILFRRNVADRAQVAALARAFREAVGRPDAPVLVDQEGGRVQRLGPPHWPAYPAAAAFSAATDDPDEQARLAFLAGRLIAEDLRAVGITVDCLPVLDVPAPGSHAVIGDRAYGRDPRAVARLGRAAAEGLLAGGVLPIIKHMPGHGRANADSHLELPRVHASLAELEEHDFAPFRANADLPVGMTAHVVFTALDAARPATLSPLVVTEIIRGRIGFEGLLISDDLSMKALSGSFRERTERLFAAGVDVALHCNGNPKEAAEVAAASPTLTGPALGRARRALARIAGGPQAGFDPVDARARLAAGLAPAPCCERLIPPDSSANRLQPILAAARGRDGVSGAGMADILPFEVEPRERSAPAADTFHVDVDGFEGPLDLLLELARRQKVDLNRISVLALAEQYLAFIEEARRVRLELAADYLVMAAWLAFLKSRLLLPEPPKADEVGAADLAAALAERLRRLEAIRTAAEQMVNRPRVGRDVALRGGGEGIQTIADPRWQATLHDLLSAYARQRQKQALTRVTLPKRAVWSLEEARATLERLTGLATEWTVLDDYLLDYCVTPEMARTVRASSFSASLEFVREGKLDIRQDRPFAPLWVRRRSVRLHVVGE